MSLVTDERNGEKLRRPWEGKHPHNFANWDASDEFTFRAIVSSVHVVMPWASYHKKTYPPTTSHKAYMHDITPMNNTLNWMRSKEREKRGVIHQISEGDAAGYKPKGDDEGGHTDDEGPRPVGREQSDGLYPLRLRDDDLQKKIGRAHV